MRDLFVTIVIFGAIPIILARPHLGVLVWAWIGFMNPHRLTWGFAYNLPFAQIVAVAILIGMFFSRERKRVPWTRESVVLLLFVAWMQITTFFAFNQAGAWQQWDKVWKIQLMVFITLILMRRPERLHMLIWIIVLSLGFYGVKGGIFSIVTGGNYLVFGPAGSFIAGNNEIALALIMIIPLMRYLQLNSERWWVRQGLTAAMGLSVVSILGSHSRGALVGIAAMLLFLVLKSRKKVLFAIVLAVFLPFSLLVMPQKWYDRMETIRDYKQDASAMGRINAWGFAYNLARDRPIVGGGFETFTHSLFQIYAPDPDNVKDAHSIFFEVLGEHGFPGLFLYLLLGFFVWRSCSRLAKETREHSELARFGDIGRMTQVSLVGYAAGGTFLGLAYFDLYYNLIGIVVLSKVILKDYFKENVSEAEDKRVNSSSTDLRAVEQRARG
jgi:probable O-glycosylation ligase (exosortase A-associated)